MTFKLHSEGRKKLCRQKWVIRNSRRAQRVMPGWFWRQRRKHRSTGSCPLGSNVTCQEWPWLPCQHQPVAAGFEADASIRDVTGPVRRLYWGRRVWKQGEELGSCCKGRGEGCWESESHCTGLGRLHEALHITTGTSPKQELRMVSTALKGPSWSERAPPGQKRGGKRWV